MRRAAFLAFAVSLAPLLARGDLPEQLRTPRAKVPVAEGVDVVEHLNERLPRDPKFRDPAGRVITLGEALAGDKPVVLTLVYFDCPMLCNLVLQGLQVGLKQSGLVLGRDYRGVTLSIDPKDDPVKADRHQTAMLRAVGSGAPADWPFLTGHEAEIRRVASAVGFGYRWDESSKQFAHPALAMVLTPDGRLSRYLYGVEFSPRDLRLAVAEAGAGRVGVTLDRALLSCFRWDPSTRRYEVYLFGIIRVGGLLVFFSLATLLTVLWRREARLRRAPASQGGIAR
jgi:protein SCO1/2